MAADRGDDTEDAVDDPEMADLVEELAELRDAVDDPAERERVAETMAMAMAVSSRGVFGRVVAGFGRTDLAQALLGSVVFGIPMFVEGGTYEVGEYLAAHPLLFGANVAVTVGLVVAILYVADIQDVRITDPILGVLPRRLVGVLGVAAVTAVGLMTLWGRVDWATPWLAACTVSVAFLPMAVGAALGDIVPGG